MDWNCLFSFLLLNAASAAMHKNFNSGTKFSNKRENSADAIADEPMNSKSMYTVFVEKESNRGKQQKNSESALGWMTRNNVPAMETHDLKHRGMVRANEDDTDFHSMTRHHGNNLVNPARFNKKSKHRRLKNHGRKFKHRRIEQMMQVPINRTPPNPNMKITQSRLLPEQNPPSDFMFRTPNVSRTILDDEPSRLTPDEDDRSSALISVIKDLRRIIGHESSQLSQDQAGSEREQAYQLDFEAGETTSTGPKITEGESSRWDLDEDQSPDILVTSVTPRKSQLSPDFNQSPESTFSETFDVLKNNMDVEELTSLDPEKDQSLEFINTDGKTATYKDEESDNLLTQPSNRTVNEKAKKISFSKRISKISRLFAEIRRARTRKISNYTMTEEKRNSTLDKVIKSKISSIETKIQRMSPRSKNPKERTKKSLDKRNPVHEVKSSTESNWIQEILEFFKQNPEILQEITDQETTSHSYFPTHAFKEPTEKSCQKTQAKPTTKKTQKLITDKTQKLTTKKKQKPSTKKVQKPTAKKGQKPTIKKEQKPTKKEQKPTANKEQKPTTKKEQKTTAKKEQKPTAKKEQKTTTKKEQKPTTKKEQKPTTKKEQKPTTNKEQKPITKKKLELTSKKTLEPTTEVEQEPTSEIEQEPSSEVELVLTSKKTQEPNMEQEPTSEMEQEPSSEMELVISSETDQDPTSEMEHESTFEVEEERDFETEQGTATEMEQETTSESTTTEVSLSDRLELALMNTSKDSMKDILKTIDELKEVLEKEREDPKRHHDPLFSLSDYITMGGMVIFTIWTSCIMGFVFLAFRKVDQLRVICTRKVKKGESSGGGG